MCTLTLDHTQEQILIFTDLDGTLLDHDTYSFDEASPSLKQVEALNIPIIINSSKTAGEIIDLKRQLNNHHPFIIENGSAILTPENPTLNDTDYTEYILGTPREEVLHTLKKVASPFITQFKQFSHCSTEELMAMTGLKYSDAEKSNRRYYTEPLQWLGDDTSKEHFIHAVHQTGLHTLQGGRFLHIMGHTDKGKALLAFKEHYTKHSKKPVKTIALGDSGNDIAMLEAADIAVVIRSKHYPPPEFAHPNKMISNQYGPAGWHEAIQKIIF